MGILVGVGAEKGGVPARGGAGGREERTVPGGGGRQGAADEKWARGGERAAHWLEGTAPDCKAPWFAICPTVSHRWSLGFEVADLEAVGRRLAATGTAATATAHPEGFRELVVADPDGNKIRLFTW